MRRRVFGLLRGAVVVAAVLVASGAVSADEPPAGFTALFNGKDLAGWRGGETFDHRKLLAMSADERKEQIRKWTAADQKNSLLEVSDATKKSHWYVENGELVNDGFGAYSSTEKDYGDFELLVD